MSRIFSRSLCGPWRGRSSKPARSRPAARAPTRPRPRRQAPGRDALGASAGSDAVRVSARTPSRGRPRDGPGSRRSDDRRACRGTGLRIGRREPLEARFFGSAGCSAGRGAEHRGSSRCGVRGSPSPARAVGTAQAHVRWRPGGDRGRAPRAPAPVPSGRIGRWCHAGWRRWPPGPARRSRGRRNGARRRARLPGFCRSATAPGRFRSEPGRPDRSGCSRGWSGDRLDEVPTRARVATALRPSRLRARVQASRTIRPVASDW